MGGKADDPATAAATLVVGFRILPMRQSAMYGLEKRKSDPV